LLLLPTNLRADLCVAGLGVSRFAQGRWLYMIDHVAVAMAIHLRDRLFAAKPDDVGAGELWHAAFDADCLLFNSALGLEFRS
jgi:hypothetical protein